jgi:hypothetical protein
LFERNFFLPSSQKKIVKKAYRLIISPYLHEKIGQQGKTSMKRKYKGDVYLINLGENI